MDKYTTVDAVNFALSGKPVEFDVAVRQALAGKMVDAIDAKREEVAQSIFTGQKTEEPEATTEE